MSYKIIFIPAAIITISIILFVPLNCFGIDTSSDKVVFYDGVALYGKLNNGTQFESTIFIESYKDVGSKPIKKFWGFDRDKPTYSIKTIKLTIGGKDALIPDEAIIDLADVTLPRGLYIMQNKQELVLYIKGGDAASAYKAALRFRDYKLVSRTIEFLNTEGELDSITKKFN
jgi:hypothetical protein